MLNQAEKKIITSIAAGYTLVIVLMIALWLSAISAMSTLHQITHRIYEYPFKVSHAVLDATQSIALIRDKMQSITLSGDPKRIAKLSAEILPLDKAAREQLGIVKADFIGDMRRVDEAESLLEKWQELRTRTIELAMHGQRDEAIILVRNTGAELFTRLDNDLDYISDFTLQQAASLLKESEKESATRINRTSWFFAVLVVLIGLTGWLVARRVLFMMRRGEQLEKALQESELHARNAIYARSLIEASLDPLVTISTEGKITDVNKATEEVTGRSRAELIGTDFSDYFTEPDMAREGYRQVFARGFVTDYPLTLRHRDGRLTDVLYNASVYRDEAGDVLGVFAAARDITARKQAEQELVRLNLQNRLILNSVGEGIYGLGIDGRCTFANPAAAQLLGFEVAELVGQHTHALFHHTRKDGRPFPEDECPVQAARKHGVVQRGEDLYWRKDGSSFPVEFIGTPIMEAGKISGAVATFRDISVRKRAEEQLQHSLRSLAEAQRIVHLGNWELDLVSNVLTWSDEIYRIFEIDPEKFGASFEAFLDGIHPDDRDRVNSAYTESVKNRTPYNIVHRLLMKDGRVKYVNERCETHYGEDGKPLRSFGTVHDITEQKVAELALIALKNDLENRVSARTAELEDANKELEAFSYSVSHDLRTPLRAIDGFSRMLLEDYAGKLDDEGKRMLHVVRDNTSRMSRLIDDILRFSRVGRIGISHAEIDMEELVHEVLDELKETIAGRKLQINLGSLPHAMGDRTMMHQVMENLLSNAIKFSSKKEDARIDIGASIKDKKVIYHVKDNGAGFDMQYVDKLFGVFQRLHGIDEFEGTGIGLAIVKRIISRHGGTIWAEGEVGKGAAFYFSIPVPSQSQGELE